MKKANYCFVCSKTNPKGLHIKFKYVGDIAVATFTLEREYEGYPGIAHGGILAAILDDAMGNVKYVQGYAAYTIEMYIRYIKPVYIGEELIVRGWIRDIHHKIVSAAGDIQDKNGVIKTRAKAKYYIAEPITN